MGLIFFARKGEAETGSILHTEPKIIIESSAKGTAQFCAV